MSGGVLNSTITERSCRRSRGALLLEGEVGGVKEYLYRKEEYFYSKDKQEENFNR